jgi:hypothetical protein
VNGERKHNGKAYDVIYQEQDKKWVDQAYRYPTKTWDASEAGNHCKSHGGSFEAAKEDQKGESTMKEIVTKENFTAAYPDLDAEIRKEAFEKGFSEGMGKGKADGAEAERNRIKDVESQLLSGHEALIEILKYDGKSTGPEAAIQILKREKDLRKVKMDDLLTDQGKNKIPEPEPGLEEVKEIPPGDKLEALVKDLMNKDKGLTYTNALIQVQKENPEVARALADQLKAGREKK